MAANKTKSATATLALTPQPPLPFQKSANSAKRDWERGSHGVEFRDRLRISAPVLPLSPAYFPSSSVVDDQRDFTPPTHYYKHPY